MQAVYIVLQKAQERTRETGFVLLSCRFHTISSQDSHQSPNFFMKFGKRDRAPRMFARLFS